ncbi:14947_t:CDS:1 [Cetraspora pellucida]|uniref:14947_t:CDS:1 n=1 Tax=Cetraspora pellucida TaxID=1433469 RepID=A0A9N9B3K1_9GLOM|nr:14947_t:CDS:1 [Cetraspora pellucida]
MTEDNEETFLSSVQQLLTLSILVKTYRDIYFNNQNTESVIKFFKNLEILPIIRLCFKCQNSMHKTKDNSSNDKQKWTCTSKTAYGHATTIRARIWLARSKLSFAQIAKIMFC